MGGGSDGVGHERHWHRITRIRQLRPRPQPLGWQRRLATRTTATATAAAATLKAIDLGSTASGRSCSSGECRKCTCCCGGHRDRGSSRGGGRRHGKDGGC